MMDAFLSDHVEITDKKIQVDDLIKTVTSPACGAISIFVGTTRDSFNGKQVVRLEYETYAPMAEKKMKEICSIIHKKWKARGIAMVHRIGLVPVTEASIVIAISTPHRKDSLEAVGFAIDTLKATVPIWKKEVYDDETSSWKENCECGWKKPR